MTEFVQGQRWVVDSEPELGLGLVVEVQERTVMLAFPEADVERNYNASQAPLTRILFETQDTITPREGEPCTVKQVHLQNGLAIYETTCEKMVVETMLSGTIKLSQPFMRLMTGQVDKPNWFNFRRDFDAATANAWQTGLKGFLGAKASLIPHQLHVANSASSLERVRVLLADEVGLGKTIEAGLILSRLLKFERVSRVLVIVPDTLQVQWLVELVRKFSIAPMLYDGEGYDFTPAGVHILPHAALCNEQEQLLTHDFDMAIIDEAHRISKDTPDFTVLKVLAASLKHLVLLTATPEQLGEQSHFARLQLLDPAKFTHYDDFKAQEQHYVALSEKIAQLPESRNALITEYNLEKTDDDNALIAQLLDQHGVGRVMFRNSRKAVAGFPQRICVSHALENEDDTTKFEWLAQWLQRNHDKKTLVICHKAETVNACQLYLWDNHGIDVAIFNEDQTLIERDKAAAYFSEPDDFGAKALLCSEIGSEGRNFQFSSDLVCLDLPDHPELLEQRIGRLDRIGQKNDVKIHILHHTDSDTAKKFDWYHNVLNCIENLSPAAAYLHDTYWDKSTLSYTSDAKSIGLERDALEEKINAGRDALLELNSCRQPEADQRVQEITAFEQTTPAALVEQAASFFQFHYEEISDDIYSLQPADKMLLPALPGLPAEGVELTYSREMASSRDDLHFITWDSPFIEGLWDVLHHSELGSASVATLPSKQLPAGQCLLEVGFDVVIQSPLQKECLRYLDQTSVRSLILDIGNSDLSDALNEQALANSIVPIKNHLAREVIKSRKAELGDWFKKAEGFAQTKADSILEKANQKAHDYFKLEMQRLHQLKRLNPFVDESDIAALETKQAAITAAFKTQSIIQLSAIRLIVITPPGS